MTDKTVLNGRYELIDRLGAGGMGSVWRAQDLTLQTTVAVKLVDDRLLESTEAIGRFKREAQAAASLRSTHVVQTLDYGVDGGRPYIVMELLEGESLAARIQRKGRLSPQETCHLMSQVAAALGRAHSKDVVHRDLKPENIFIVNEGAGDIAKVLDFGIAKVASTFSETSGSLTKTGAVMGTPYYMSPEQAIGKREGIDARSDIWSFGVIVFECLSGLRPFEGETLGQMFAAICIEPLPVPSERGVVLQGFDSWFARAVARDKLGRFASIAEAAEVLQAVVEGREVPAPRENNPRVLAPSLDEPRPTFPQSSELQLTAAPASVTLGGRTGRGRVGVWVLAGVGVVVLGLGALGANRWLSAVPQVTASAPGTLGGTSPSVPLVETPKAVTPLSGPEVVPVPLTTSTPIEVLPVTTATAPAPVKATAASTKKTTSSSKDSSTATVATTAAPSQSSTNAPTTSSSSNLRQRVGF